MTRGWMAIAPLVCLAGCVEDHLVPCRDGELCPAGWQPIEYPDANMNVLSRSLTTYVSGSTPPALAFTADMHTNAALSIRITLTNGTSCTQWQYEFLGADFTADGCFDGPVETFTTMRSGVVQLAGFHFTGTGSATIDYFEYGSATPQFTKNVTWAP